MKLTFSDPYDVKVMSSAMLEKAPPDCMESFKRIEDGVIVYWWHRLVGQIFPRPEGKDGKTKKA